MMILNKCVVFENLMHLYNDHQPKILLNMFLIDHFMIQFYLKKRKSRILSTILFNLCYIICHVKS